MSQSLIDKYEIISTIGKGSMGVVYKAKDPEIGRIVAVKTLKSIYIGDDSAGNEALQRFRQESRSAGKLHHPNIVTIFEAGRSSNGSPYIVMEYIDGKSLESLIAEKGSLDHLAVMHFMSQIANALDYAHAQDVIHRDVKPSNIIIDGKNKPYLLDFGVAKLSDTSLTPAGTVVGTPSYMSPEQIRGTDLDGRSDVFSFAVVVFEALTGKRPFPGNDFTTVISNIINKDPLSFKDVGSNLPLAVEKIIQRALSKNINERQHSALDFIEEVAQALGVLVDGNGLVGGYYQGIQLEDHQKSNNLSQRVKAKTVVGSFSPESMGLKATLNKGKEENHSDVEATAAYKIDDLPINDNQGISSMMQENNFIQDVQGNKAGSSLGKGLFVFIFIVVSIGIGAYLNKAQVIKLLNKGIESTKVEEEQIILSTEENNKVEDESDLRDTDNIATIKKEETLAPTNENTLPSENETTRLDPDLEKALSSENKDKETFIAAVKKSLEKEGEELNSLLAIALSNSDYKVRIDVLKLVAGVGIIKREQLSPEIIKLLNDEEFLVRGFAVKVLAQIDSPKVIASLEERQKIEKNQIVLKVLNDSLSQIRNNNVLKE